MSARRGAVETHDVVIVGAGLAGAATAWHLGQRGRRDVVVLERDVAPGLHASGRNACIVREAVGHAAWQPLATEGAAWLRRGDLVPFRATGGLLLGDGEDEAARHAPGFSGRGLWCPGDGVVDAVELLGAYLDGTEVRCDTAFLDLAPDGDALRLETTAGPLRARLLVNAAGPWAGLVGRLPLRPLGRTVFVVADPAGADPDRPWVWDLAHDWYARPLGGAWLLCPCDEAERPPGVYPVEPAALETLRARLARWHPPLADLPVLYRWSGQRTFAEDRAPVVGFDPREPRLFHVAALGGHGLTASWSVGALAADLICRAGRAPAALAADRLLAGVSHLR